MRRLAGKFATTLGGTPLRVRTANLGSKGTVYRIQSAAVLTSGDARKICAAMKAKRQACFVIAK